MAEGQKEEKKSAAVPGLSSKPPVKGRSVKTKGGYMTSYRATIPGTKVTFDMVPIPGGKFVIGSPPEERDRVDDEGPQVELEVKPFWIGRCEVTWAEYWVFMDCYELFREQRFGREEPRLGDVDAVTAPTPLYSPEVAYQFGDGPGEPAVTMTHYAARQYTKWLSLLTGEFYRLPTEAEWEYAARAGSKTAYFFGDDSENLEQYAWFKANSNQKYHSVGSKKANPWGLHDIYGNVAELTLDPYESDTYQMWKVGTRSAGPLNWVKRSHREVVRGGSFESGSGDVRSAARASTHADWQDSDPNVPKSPWWFTEGESCVVGFRLVRPLRKSQRGLWERQWGAMGKLKEDVKARVEEGRGGLGPVSPALGGAIRRQQDKKGNREQE